MIYKVNEFSTTLVTHLGRVKSEARVALNKSCWHSVGVDASRPSTEK
jgi:hypothetical protein